MLQEISIKNFAIIEEIHLSFESGMTILTGETGAGKSIIIDAMGLLLGGRSSSDFVRTGKDKAEIEGLFFAGENAELDQKLESLGLERSTELILRRDIFANGRSVCRVNGQMVNLTTLREIGELLVDIHGQHDNQELMNAKHHLRLLDEFGDENFEQIKAEYQVKFEHYKKMRQALETRQKNEQEFAQRIEILQFQVEEIEAAEIDLKEDEQLQHRRDKLNNAKNIADALNTAYLALDDEEGDFSSLSGIRTAMAELENVAEFDQDYQDLSDKTMDAYYLLEEVSTKLSTAIESIEFNPTELLQIEERILTLNTLRKKYGPELSDVLKTLEKIQLELSDLMGGTENSESLEEALKEAQAELLIASEHLNTARHAIAKELETDIKKELADLYMEKADFSVQFESGKFSSKGNEQVEFYIQTNPGEGFKPLAKTASGGELSRLMLAIKSSFSRRENKTSIVFDEVDTGVSGRVAQAIAQKIYKIAQAGQVLAISHLPQVVAIADTQFYIEKASTDDVTTSTVRKLKLEERVEEVAKMLAGDDITVEALAQAKRLLTK
ncbi:DNA repair protein RecN [Lactococcus formosensis]|jgi:DNA repair protein RecN|uniref:DNA repair protein RecN n=1 Tax=Lactococcus formosensis TaxID=1281486 RepID=A0A9X4NVW6_9LACT|nr:DNA repair protein RecN [Lactococcus formosensis]NHI67015.1 DNA repair protein RecN [Lactococcus garvieae]MCH1722990.1 DNA repair protein RecN [Lactococcus formosensis]MCO7180605.1 DNA repair protein RecN [Lactococcus formosensis]MDG6112027.1 DNA repair protein RecN [Lactococcus formosensis]MDG6112715.1 DNA repair protein RecN [Lactococcus formosensis]